MTEQGKFTPEPWRIGPYYRNEVVADGKYICRTENETGENVANARLIAAAPELYKVLKDALSDAESRLYALPPSLNDHVSAQKDRLSSLIGRYRAAIDKAEGRQ